MAVKVNKVVFAGQTLIDLSGDSVTPGTLVAGATAHDAAGNLITGTAVTVTDNFEGKVSTFKAVSSVYDTTSGTVTETDAAGNTLVTVLNSDGSITETYTPVSGTVITRTRTISIGTNNVITDTYVESGVTKTRTTTIDSSGNATISYS